MRNLIINIYRIQLYSDTLIQKQASSQLDVLRNKIIIPTGEKAYYPEARESVKEKGGLPSNLAHEGTLVYSDRVNQIYKYYEKGAFAAELLVHPEANGIFTGQDIIAMSPDPLGREWRFVGTSIPEDAKGKERIGLLVLQSDLEVDVEGKRLIFSAKPESISILQLFPQRNWCGKVDERTGIPIQTPHESPYGEIEKTIPFDVRLFSRTERENVVPIVRFAYGPRGRYLIDATVGRSFPLGVGYVDFAEAKRE